MCCVGVGVCVELWCVVLCHVVVFYVIFLCVLCCVVLSFIVWRFVVSVLVLVFVLSRVVCVCSGLRCGACCVMLCCVVAMHIYCGVLSCDPACLGFGVVVWLCCVARLFVIVRYCCALFCGCCCYVVLF